MGVLTVHSAGRLCSSVFHWPWRHLVPSSLPCQSIVATQNLVSMHPFMKSSSAQPWRLKLAISSMCGCFLLVGVLWDPGCEMHHGVDAWNNYKKFIRRASVVYRATSAKLLARKLD